MGTRCYIGCSSHWQADRLKALKRPNRNRICNFFRFVDEMTLERGMVHSMPLVLTENGLNGIKNSIKNSLFKYLEWAGKEGFSEGYTVQCAINNVLSRVNSWIY